MVVRVLDATVCKAGMELMCQDLFTMEKTVYAWSFFHWALQKQNGMNPGKPPDWISLEMHPADARRIRMRVLGLIAKKMGV